MTKEYLGDGVYVEYVADRNMFRLTVEDGVRILQEIWLEGFVYMGLVGYVRRLQHKMEDAKNDTNET